MYGPSVSQIAIASLYCTLYKFITLQFVKSARGTTTSVTWNEKQR